MKGVRKEERNSEKLRVLLGSTVDSLAIVCASTENVSSNGLRVLTEWPRPRDTQLTVLSFESELWDRARVVYCQPLSGNLFALGLEFLTRRGELIMQSAA